MIVARGLTCTFGDGAPAVRGLDLDVEAGEIVGLLGAHGAGKTTVQRMLATVLAPTAGEATIDGHDLLREGAYLRRHVGYVAQRGQDELTARSFTAKVEDELATQAEQLGIASLVARKRAAYLRNAFDLGVYVRSLSDGERRRLDLARALIHEPRVLVLDEPSTGLDPDTRADLWRHIAELRDLSLVTVVLATSCVEEATALCDRVMVLDAGRVVAASARAIRSAPFSASA